MTAPPNKSQATVTSPRPFVSILLSSVAGRCPAGARERLREPPSGASSGLTPLVRLPLLDSLLASPPPHPTPASVSPHGPGPISWARFQPAELGASTSLHSVSIFPARLGRSCPASQAPGQGPLCRGCRPCSTRAPPPLLQGLGQPRSPGSFSWHRGPTGGRPAWSRWHRAGLIGRQWVWSRLASLNATHTPRHSTHTPQRWELAGPARLSRLHRGNLRASPSIPAWSTPLAAPGPASPAYSGPICFR